jgi:hypothetical protein
MQRYIPALLAVVESGSTLTPTLVDTTLVEVHAPNLTCLGLELNLVEVQ